MSEIPKSVAAALVRAQAESHAVEKTAKNTHHGYKYASAESIITAARAALKPAGLAHFCVEWRIARHPEPHVDCLLVTFALAHESGDVWTCPPVETPIIPDKGRPEDKASFTALTYATGYHLRGLLCLPRVAEGEEVDTRDDREHVPARHRPRGAPAELSPQVSDQIRAACLSAGIGGAEVARIAFAALGKPLAAMTDADAPQLIAAIGKRGAS